MVTMRTEMTKTSIIENLPNFSTKFSVFPGHLDSHRFSEAIQSASILNTGKMIENAKMSDAIPLESVFHMCVMPCRMEKLEVLNSSGKRMFMISV